MRFPCKLVFLAIGVLVSLPTRSFADSWSGALVDAKCFAFEERNVNPTDTMTSVDRDFAGELRYCSPSTKTKAFSLVERDGTTFRLDAEGNAKALDILAKSGKKDLTIVVVTGEREKNIIKVTAMAMSNK